MKIEINIRKVHFIVIIALLGIGGFAIAYGGNQPNVMGHTDGEIRLPALNQNLDVWSGSINTQVVSHTSSINTIQTSYCRQDGTNCPSVTGRVVGGGVGSAFPSGYPCSYTWGAAACNNGDIVCNSGTERTIGYESQTGGGVDFYAYLCII